ncbi:hypothetical protein Tco_0516696 [Tanacetum coccineum]
MKSCVYFLKNPWIIAFLLPIFTFAYGSFSYLTISIFLITTILIFVSSSFMYFSKHNLDEHVLVSSDHKSSNKHVKDEAKIIGYLDMDVPESWLGNEMIGGFTSEEHSEFESESLDCSDGSMTDEESLIEIELPTTNYEWSEMNEEENLFEIDISIGSIK